MNAEWLVRAGKNVLKDLDHIPEKDLLPIKKAIHGLAYNPFPEKVRKLKGQKDLILRIRVGKYRIIYQVRLKDRLVIILAVSQRKDSYR